MTQEYRCSPTKLIVSTLAWRSLNNMDLHAKRALALEGITMKSLRGMSLSFRISQCLHIAMAIVCFAILLFFILAA